MKKTYLSLITLCIALSASAQWTTSGTNIYNSNTGNVGIGTTTPGFKLDIAGNVRLSSGSLLFFDNSTSGSNIYQHNTGSFSMNASTAGGGNGNLVLNAASGAGIYLNFSSGANTYFGNGASGTTGIIQSNGNVGIGTISPGAKLDVEGGILRVGNGSGSYSGFLFDNTSGLTQENNNKVTLQGALQVNSTAGMDSYITGSGNVGIGTTNTNGYKLAVNGGIHSRSVKVDLTGWPDFVFLKDYKLPTLTEVKTYIDKNQHLPDIPSADEVHANGLDLGEMNRLLLKKVEELTLYLIEQKNTTDSKLKAQQYQIDQLNKKIKTLTK
ncbi:hypothetical protein [Mucilaginibacter sp. HD30]